MLLITPPGGKQSKQKEKKRNKKQAGQPAERERSIGVKELQIYRRGRVYAVVNKYNNYSLNTKGEEPDEFVDFPHVGSWLPVKPNNVPAWLKDQIAKANLL